MDSSAMAADKNSMTAATEAFLAAATWLGVEDAPAVALLRLTAFELDMEYNATKANVYGATHRQLMKRAPKAAPGPQILTREEQFLEDNAL